MLKKANILLIIFVLGVFLIPGQSYACKTHAKKQVIEQASCCEHHDSQDKETCKKKCCQEKKDGTNPCSGKCGSHSCQNSSQNFSVTLPFTKCLGEQFNIEDEKSYSPYKQPYYSSGYHSIWQPPKIS
ncbi:hypothetical protein CMU73_04005 [Elizabethkingia anophelis]|nr:hypothetical protein A6J37_14760 [Elizabethkingia anophelis]MDV3551366.1 hypothetical protein [Elizabethkingia anophelis]MDV3569806.1 hypothetical protein [Elizabethkingia anophelis]MDV3668927.1 hypothetical protein [Elizabethkingia anophelis]MDV3672715.1 hypothetical protein [Elizabethkingia anophelis]